MILYGGYNPNVNIPFSSLTDTWVLTNANGLGGTPTWMRLTTLSNLTDGRYYHSLVYDTVNNRTILFAGYGHNYMNDTWVLTNANGLGGTPTWIQLTTSGVPPTVRVGHTGVYDQTNNLMIVFGGTTTNGSSLLSDVNVLANANGLGGTPTWTQLSTIGSFGVTWHTAVYDTSNNLMIVFGGQINGSPTNGTFVLTNANGLASPSVWTQLTTTGGPPPTLADHVAVYDSNNNRMIVFGGGNGVGYVNDVWVLSNANGLGGTPAWTQLSISGSTAASPRVFHSAIYDPINNLMTIFAGENSSNAELNDTWVLNMANGLPVELSQFEAVQED